MHLCMYIHSYIRTHVRHGRYVCTCTCVCLVYYHVKCLLFCHYSGEQNRISNYIEHLSAEALKGDNVTDYLSLL